MDRYMLVKIAATVLAALSQIMLKISANREYKNKLFIMLNPLVIISYGIFFITMVMSVYSLKGMSISLGNVVESINYILIPVLSYIFLKEKINRTQFIGIIVIIIGITVFMI